MIFYLCFKTNVLMIAPLLWVKETSKPKLLEQIN